MPKRTTAKIHAIRKSLRPETWEGRLNSAAARARLVREVEAARKQGESEGAALARLAPELNRSTYHGIRRRFRAGGEENLIDGRHGGAPRSLVPEARQVICALRRADQGITAERISAVVKAQLGVEVSKSAINKLLKAEGLNVPPGGNRLPREPIVEELQFGGAVFFQLADQELGCSAGLADEIVELARAAPAPDEDAELRDEAVGRDEFGHFGAGYNQARAKGDAKLGPAFRSVEETRRETDLRNRKLAKERPETVLRKVQAVLALPLLTETSRTLQLDDYRAGHGIAEFCGKPYTGDTIDRFLRDGKYLGLAGPLSEYHAGFWLAHEPRAAEEPAAACVYLDGVGKPLWTSLFTKAGKVSSAGRVMPVLDQVFVCTGAGTPIFWQPFSGHGSLVTHTIPIVEKLEAIVGEDWCAERLFVIDGEANAVGLFKQFDAKKRLFVTILRDNQVADTSRVENLTDWRPFRNGDEIAEGEVVLIDSHDKKAPYRAGVVLIRRRRKGTLTVLATNAPGEEYSAETIANSYFARWPNQELRFRTLNQGTRFKAVHGYGKRLVLNVAVLSKLDELRARKDRLEHGIATRQAQVQAAHQELTTSKLRLNAAKARRARQDGLVAEEAEARRIDRDVLKGRIEVTQAERDRLSQAEEAVRKAASLAAAEEAKLDKLKHRLPELSKEIALLEGRREIFQADTELDSLMTTFKLFFALICEFAARTYFPGLRISLHGFMRQILTLPGTRAIEGKVEHIRIKASPNREIMMAVEAACERINAREIVRDGRAVRLSVQWQEGAHLRGAKASR